MIYSGVTMESLKPGTSAMVKDDRGVISIVHDYLMETGQEVPEQKRILFAKHATNGLLYVISAQV